MDPCLQYAKSLAHKELLCKIVRDHLLHDPACKFFKRFIDACPLPELFHLEVPALQEMLQDCTDRKHAHMKEMTAAGYARWNEETKTDTSADSSSIFNYWTSTYFSAPVYHALVPPCNIGPA